MYLIRNLLSSRKQTRKIKSEVLTLSWCRCNHISTRIRIFYRHINKVVNSCLDCNHMRSNFNLNRIRLMQKKDWRINGFKRCLMMTLMTLSFSRIVIFSVRMTYPSWKKPLITIQRLHSNSNRTMEQGNYSIWADRD